MAVGSEKLEHDTAKRSDNSGNKKVTFFMIVLRFLLLFQVYLEWS